MTQAIYSADPVNAEVPKNVTKGMHAACIPSCECIHKQYNLEKKLEPKQVKELGNILKEHMNDIEKTKIPKPVNHGVYITDYNIFTIDSFIPGRDLLRESFQSQKNLRDYIHQTKEIIKNICQFRKPGINRINHTDNYISVDPVLANFVVYKENVYYVDFFVPKTRTADGDFRYFPQMHKLDKKSINYIHFNKIGVFHHFYKKNQIKNPDLRFMLYETLQKDAYVNDILKQTRLNLKDFQEPYEDIMRYIGLKGDNN